MAGSKPMTISLTPAAPDLGNTVLAAHVVLPSVHLTMSEWFYTAFRQRQIQPHYLMIAGSSNSSNT